jgi:hypothetical protein
MAYSIPDKIGGFDNNGTFSRVENWVSDRNAGIKILAESMDKECDNFAEAFNQCLTRDMKGKPERPFDFNGFGTKNLVADYLVSQSACTLEQLVVDPTRLFYDHGSDTQILLWNKYLQNPTLNVLEDGFHFYFLSGSTIMCDSDALSFNYMNTSINRVVLDSVGAVIPAGTIKENGLYEAVMLTNLDSKKCIYIFLNNGGGGGDGGRVDSIVNWPGDTSILIDSTNPFSPKIKTNPAKVVLSVEGEGPDATGNVNLVDKVVKSVSTKKPDLDGDVMLTIDHVPPDLDGNFSHFVRTINGMLPSEDGVFTGLVQKVGGLAVNDTTHNVEIKINNRPFVDGNSNITINGKINAWNGDFTGIVETINDMDPDEEGNFGSIEEGLVAIDHRRTAEAYDTVNPNEINECMSRYSTLGTPHSLRVNMASLPQPLTPDAPYVIPLDFTTNGGQTNLSFGRDSSIYKARIGIRRSFGNCIHIEACYLYSLELTANCRNTTIVLKTVNFYSVHDPLIIDNGYNNTIIVENAAGTDMHLWKFNDSLTTQPAFISNNGGKMIIGEGITNARFIDLTGIGDSWTKIVKVGGGSFVSIGSAFKYGSSDKFTNHNVEYGYIDYFTYLGYQMTPAHI